MTASPLRFDFISLFAPMHNSDRVFRLPQFNRDLHFVHTMRGEGYFFAGGKRHHASTGSIIAVPNFTQCIFEKEAGKPWEMLNFHYRLYLPSGLPIEALYQLPILFRPKNQRKIEGMLRECERLRGKTDFSSMLQMGTVLLTLSTRYWLDHGCLLEKEAPADRVMIQLGERLRTSTHFEAEPLAAGIHLSVSQMNRRFKRTWRVSPKEFWLRQRLTEAQERLHGSEEKISAIAETVGFLDPFFFSKWFKQRVGMSPGKFREQCRQRDI